jgi:hypothetical protein
MMSKLPEGSSRIDRNRDSVVVAFDIHNLLRVAPNILNTIVSVLRSFECSDFYIASKTIIAAARVLE